MFLPQIELIAVLAVKALNLAEFVESTMLKQDWQTLLFGLTTIFWNVL